MIAVRRWSLLSAEAADDPDLRRMIDVETHQGVSTAVQCFSLIDSNQAKDLRNRLTAAALIVWVRGLGTRVVTMVEGPWLPADVFYAVCDGLPTGMRRC